MELRSGKTFAPYSLKRIFRWETGHAEPVSTSVDAEPLIQAAVARENEFFDLGGDDSEGLGVTLRPPSPLTDLESGDGADDDTEATNLPPPPAGQSSGPCSGIEKKRRNRSASRRRSSKRAKIASSSHGPHAYAAKPSVVKHHAKALQPLRVPIDASGFPSSGSGSWVGKRSKGAKKEPWTLPELINGGFSVIEWDGR